MSEATGFFGVIIGLVVLTIIVYWVIFPIILMSKFNELLKVVRELLKETKDASTDLRAMRKYYEPESKPTASPEPERESLAQR